MHFGILKMIATSGFLTSALECTKFVFGRGSARTLLGSLQRSLTGLRGNRTSKGMGRGRPLTQIPGSAPVILDDMLHVPPVSATITL